MIISKIKNKILAAIKRRQYPEALRDQIPWITYDAKNWLESNLKKDMAVFEWGSGGSTLYLALRVKKIISIEHDGHWFEAVQRFIKKKRIINCEHYLIKPTQLNAVPKYNSQNPKYKNCDFSEYCQVIDKYPDNYFDLIIIDGRARPHCIIGAKNKVKIGGYMLLDDSDRDYYQESLLSLDNYTRKDFFGPGPYLNFPWGTSIFKRHD